MTNLSVKLSNQTIEKAFAFLLPSLIILGQWFSIGGINVSWIVSLILIIRIFARKKIILPKHIFLFAVIVFIVPIINFSFSISKKFNVALYVSISLGCIVMLYVYTLTSDLYNIYINGVFISCVVFSFWGIYEMFTGNYLIAYNDQFSPYPNWTGLRYPIVAFPNPNDIGQYLAFLFPLSSIKLIEKKKYVTFVIGFVAAAFVIYESDSRLSLLSFLAIYFIFYIVYMKKHNDSKKIIRLISGISIFIIGLLFVNYKTNFISKLYLNFIALGSSKGEVHFEKRWVIYKRLLQISSDHPLGAFGLAYETTSPHNFFLYVLCDYGWLVFLLLVVLIIKMIVTTYREAIFKDDNIATIMIFATLCLFPLLSCVSSGNEQRKVLWEFLGIALYTAYDKRKYIVT